MEPSVNIFTEQINALNTSLEIQTQVRDLRIQKNREALIQFENELDPATPLEDQIKMYKELIKQLAIDVRKEVFSTEFIQDHQLDQYHKVTVIDGSDLNLALFGNSDFVPDSKDFLVYVFPCPIKPVFLKIFECKHIGNIGISCGVVMTNLKKFIQHLCIHSNERPYQCSVETCGQMFFQRSHLNRHMNSQHSSVFKFSCETCGNQFKIKDHLKKHIKNTHSDKAETKSPYIN